MSSVQQGIALLKYPYDAKVKLFFKKLKLRLKVKCNSYNNYDLENLQDPKIAVIF